MKKILLPLLTFVLLSLLTSCSQKYLMTTFFFKAPKLPIRETAAFKALNPMQQDVELLIALIKDAYPMWEQKITPTELETEHQRLLQLFSTSKDPVLMEMETQRLLSRLRDVHTKALTFSLQTKRFFSLRYLQIRDSFILVNIGHQPPKDSTLLLGSLIERINGFSRAEFNAKIRAFESAEDTLALLYRSSLSNPIYLKTIGLATQTDSVRLTLKTRNGEMLDVVLPAVEKKDFGFYKIQKPASPSPYKPVKDNYSYLIDKKNDLAYLNVGTMLDFVCFNDGFKQYVKNPLLRPLAKAWMKKKAKKMGNMNFKNFALSAIEAANTEGVKNLVIDLRANGGGDMRIPQQLFYLLDFEVKKNYTDYHKLSDYYKTNLSDDAKHTAELYQKATGKPLVFDGRLLNMDSISSKTTRYDFYEDVKNPKSAFYIAPTTPRFGGKVYFLTGYSTASAASITATLVKDNALATIVGIPAGNKPTGQTGASGFKLPHSKVVGVMSYFYKERPNTAKNEETALQPDAEIWQELDDLYQGIDTQMAWIINDIAARQAVKK
jgi:Peptidase family S41